MKKKSHEGPGNGTCATYLRIVGGGKAFLKVGRGGGRAFFKLDVE